MHPVPVTTPTCPSWFSTTKNSLQKTLQGKSSWVLACKIDSRSRGAPLTWVSSPSLPVIVISASYLHLSGRKPLPSEGRQNSGLFSFWSLLHRKIVQVLVGQQRRFLPSWFLQESLHCRRFGTHYPTMFWAEWDTKTTCKLYNRLCCREPNHQWHCSGVPLL